MGINKHIGGHNMTYQKRLTSNDITSTDQTLQMLKYIRTLENLMGEREQHQICEGLQVTCSLLLGNPNESNLKLAKM
jgi:hypothetical protein